MSLPSPPTIEISISDIADYVQSADLELPSSIVVTAAPTIATPPVHQDLVLRATGANCGLADVLEVYSIYGRQYTGSQELSRVLVKFPVENEKKNNV